MSHKNLVEFTAKVLGYHAEVAYSISGRLKWYAIFSPGGEIVLSSKSPVALYHTAVISDMAKRYGVKITTGWMENG